MDIIDILLARAMTPQGKTETYVSIANAAAAKAEKAQEDAETAIATIEAAAESIAETQESASTLLSDAQAALETAQAAQLDIPSTEDIDAEVKKMVVNTNTVNGQNANTLQVITTYPDNTLNTQNITKLYKQTGNNEDGGMTQKAITDALASKANVSDLNAKADITYVNNKVSQITITGGGGVSNLGAENSGKIVIVGSDGNIIAGSASEEDIISALIANGGYSARDAVGLEIDFNEKTFTRTQEAAGKSMGTDFDSYPMFGGRRRCIVNDSGEIIAFYGDASYTEESANYQVMIYQPKFYYQRTPLRIIANKVGKTVEKDSIIISATAQSGFKVHPLFIANDGTELDYVLIGAYESGIYSVSSGGTYQYVNNNVDFNADKLVSKANVKPLTGSSDLSLARAEQLARNRGEGWHIYTIQAESANQMLEMIEFGTLNGQNALGKGVSYIVTNGDYNQAAITGSTSSLGNASGSATSTRIETNSISTTETENGKVSISYRGMENPWGNTWTMLGGILVYGDSTVNGGIPFICSNYNYSYSQITNNYSSAAFSLPNSTGWISNFGYGISTYDWLLMPSEVNINANSVLPIGDNGWFDSNLMGLRLVAHGGSWSFEEANGPFYYACDKAPNDSSYKSYGARLLFIPTKNSTYTANIAKWQTEMNKGG